MLARWLRYSSDGRELLEIWKLICRKPVLRQQQTNKILITSQVINNDKN